MPTIYRLQCDACGKSPEVESALAGWVTTDGRKEGRILPDGYLAVRLDNGEFKPLPHPVEDSTLRQLGFTWAGAAKQSKLFRVTFKICHTCGTLHEERQHQDSRTGCLVATVSIPISVITLKFGFGQSFGSALFGAFMATMVVMGIFLLANWLRWRSRNDELKLASCAKCHSKKFITIPKAVRQVLMCPHCMTQNLRCNIAGMS